MTKNIENTLKYAKIEVTGFQDLCRKLGESEEENKQLRQDNKVLGGELTYFKELAADYEDEINFLKRQNEALKLRCSNYSLRIGELETEIADMKFTRKYLTSEEAGRAFARELLGKPMTEEEFIAEGEAHYNKFAFIGDDF